MKASKPFQLILALIIVLSLTAQPSFSAQAATNNYVVTPASTDWAFANDNGSVGDWTTGFVNGPATPPLGVGSANIQLNSAAAGILIGAQKYQGTRLADITALSYSTYTNLSPAAMAFQINYDPDVTTIEAATWYGRLIYEPYMNGTVTNGVWQTWDMLNGGAGKWWASPNGNSTVDNACPQAAPCTLTDLLTAFPNIGVRNDALSAIVFKAGSNWNGFNGNVDNFTFETGGDTDIYNFEPVSIIYVDDDWAGTPLGTDPDGAGPAVSFGADSFDVIQDGIDAVANNGTVIVYAGTYVEELLIDHPLSLLGPNASIDPNTGSRVAEAILQPSSTGVDPYGSCTVMAYLTSSDVTIQGFTFDGDNPLLSGGAMIGAADVDACELIASYEGIANTVIEYNILRHSTYSGIDLYNYYNGGGATSGNYLRYNRLENIGETVYNWGIGVLVYNNFYADITHNVFDNVRVGVQTGNFYNANPGATGSISNNTINAWRLGIFHNLWYSNASTIPVANNTITAVDSGTAIRWNGILLSSFQSAVDTVITNNTINIGAVTQTPTAGYNIWNTTTSAVITIQGGSVNGGNYGIWVNNYEGYTSNADNTSIYVDGVAISNASTAGIYVLDSASNTNGATVYANVQNSAISGSAVGLLMAGSDANAVINYSNIYGNTTGITNTSGNVMNAENNWWGGEHGPDDPAGTIEVPIVPEPSVADMLNAAPVGMLGNGVSDNVDYYPFQSNDPLLIAPNPVIFGDQLIGTTSAPQTVTVTNTSSIAQVIGLVLTGTEFAISNDTCTPAALNPGASCTFDVTFSPSGIGPRSGSIDVFNSTVQPYILSLQGTGVGVPAGTNLLKKPDFASANIFPNPWQLFGVRRPYGSILDCSIYQIAPCSVSFPSGNRSALQRVTRSGLAGDMYFFGLSSMAQNAGGIYRVEASLYNNFNRLVGTTSLNFTPGTHGWETVSGYVTATGSYNKIIFRFYYNNPSGRVWFDDAFLMVAP